MAETASLRHSTPSPTLRDKIRLFEGKGNSPQLSSIATINRTLSTADFRSNSPYRGPRLSPLRTSSIENNSRPTVGESSRRRPPESLSLSSLPITPSLSTTTTTTTTSSTTTATSTSTPETPAISPRKWNVITLDPDQKNTTTTTTTSTTPTRDKGKEKVTVLSLDYDRELVTDSDEENQPQMKLPILAKSPRRPSQEQKYEEEMIKLKRMTNEEKQMVKVLIKLTTRKNKMLDELELNIHKERQALSERVEAEKASLYTILQALDLELATKSRELATETMRNNDLAEKIQKLERDRQDIRMALAASKRESRQCKLNCDAELNKKTQSLMDMAMQLTALTCLRQSMNCIICEEKVAIAVLQPCRHMVMCGPCSNKVTKCPMCRVDIRNKFEIFNNWVI